MLQDIPPDNFDPQAYADVFDFDCCSAEAPNTSNPSGPPNPPNLSSDTRASPSVSLQDVGPGLLSRSQPVQTPAVTGSTYTLPPQIGQASPNALASRSSAQRTDFGQAPGYVPGYVDWGFVTDGSSRPSKVAPSCTSSCAQACPSQCGEEGQGSICCADESCEATQNPCAENYCCDDQNCLDGASAVPGGGEEAAAAAALASFGEAADQNFHKTSLLPWTTQFDSVQNDFSKKDPNGWFSTNQTMPDWGFDGTASMNQAFSPSLTSHIFQYHIPFNNAGDNTGPCSDDHTNLDIPPRCNFPLSSGRQGFAGQSVDLSQNNMCGFEFQDLDDLGRHVYTQHPKSIFANNYPHSTTDTQYSSKGYQTPRHEGHTPGVFHPSSFQDLGGYGMGSSQHISTSPSSSTNHSMRTEPLLTPDTISTSPSRHVNSDQGGLLNEVSTERTFGCLWILDGSEKAICHKKFNNSKELDAHCRNDHIRDMSKSDGSGFRCRWEGCKRASSFPQRGKLNRHLQVHTGCKCHHGPRYYCDANTLQ